MKLGYVVSAAIVAIVYIAVAYFTYYTVSSIGFFWGFVLLTVLFSIWIYKDVRAQMLFAPK